MRAYSFDLFSGEICSTFLSMLAVGSFISGLNLLFVGMLTTTSSSSEQVFGSLCILDLNKFVTRVVRVFI